MGKSIKEWQEHFKSQSIEQLKNIHTALVTLEKDKWLDKEYFKGVCLSTILIIVKGELRAKEQIGKTTKKGGRLAVTPERPDLSL